MMTKIRTLFHLLPVLCVVTTLLMSGCSLCIAPSISFPWSISALPTPTVWGVQTKTSHCQVHGALPDARCTPGDIIVSATMAQICTPGYASYIRDIPQSVKHRVFASYGIASHRPGAYEVDHLVSLELGGSNAISNLWPEAASPRPGFYEKDQVENYLHGQVCTGKIPLLLAQAEIATNWLNVWNSMKKENSLISAILPH